MFLFLHLPPAPRPGESIDRDTRTPDRGRIQITGFTGFTTFIRALNAEMSRP